MSIAKLVCLIVAVVLFVLASLSVSIYPRLHLGWLGLAFATVAQLVP